ncbi:MAG TPA: NUDIX domain-containing protein [Planctomycetota bacterium]|nr:NUDIX domain-containing protein [Planctomycetota bacterium]
MATSAGLLLFRGEGAGLEVLLVHPGGPYWRKLDAGAWSIPKGGVEPGEDPLAAARREFEEETGTPASGEALPLTPVRQAGGKLVLAWAMRGDFDPAALRSNTFELEWPPRSGLTASFPEVDQAAWFSLREARRRVLAGQCPLIDELESLAGGAGRSLHRR